MKKLKQLLVITICLLVNINLVKASTLTYKRTENNNYGVNKHWTITERNINNVKNTPLVDASEKIYDFADILTEEEEQEIYEEIQKFIEKTDMDMVFVSIDMAYTYDSKNEDYAADFYDYNDFGIDFENYSGILLLRNNYELDRYYDMYTFGNAQLYFDQSRYDNILDGIYSDFVNKNYLTGIKTFIRKCSSYYDSGYVYKYKNSYVDENGYINTRYHVPYIGCSIGALVITLITMTILVKKNKMVKKATTAAVYLDKGTVNYSVQTDQFLRSHTTHYTTSSSSGSSGGGSHSGSSGGGHSSGGGRHG